MDHFGNDQDKEIVELLGRLSQTGPEYPPRLFAARRAAVIATLAALPFAGAAAVSLFGKLASTVKAMSIIDKVILGVEVAAITGVTAAGAALAYVYRDELKSLIQSVPTAIIAPVPSVQPIPTLSVSTEPVLPTLEATPSESPTPTGTIYITDTNVPTGDQEPGATPEGTKPGLHLGQTPHPTKKP